MMGRLRGRASPILARLASKLTWLHPDALTIAGLALHAPYLLLCSLHHPVAAAATLVAAGLLDALDGAVARARGGGTPAGGFLDSVVDRISDFLEALGLLLLGLPPTGVLVYLGGSFTTSYARCRFELAGGGGMEGVGLLERGDRVAALAVLLLAYALAGYWAATLLLWLLAGLAWVTATERVVRGYLKLRSGGCCGGVPRRR